MCVHVHVVPKCPFHPIMTHKSSTISFSAKCPFVHNYVCLMVEVSHFIWVFSSTQTSATAVSEAWEAVQSDRGVHAFYPVIWVWQCSHSSSSFKPGTSRFQAWSSTRHHITILIIVLPLWHLRFWVKLCNWFHCIMFSCWVFHRNHRNPATDIAYYFTKQLCYNFVFSEYKCACVVRTVVVLGALLKCWTLCISRFLQVVEKVLKHFW